MKKILVTGGAGYIGSACTEYLLDLGYQVTVFDALITGHRDAVDPRAEFIEGHLGDRQLILDVCRKGGFDAIMHFAAFSLVGESMKDPGKYFGNNLACGINLADAAIAGNVKTFVFSSTAATFGQPERIPISEDDRQIPINPYGESKLCFEKVLKWYSSIYGMKYVALRYFNAAGATALHGEDHRPESHLIPIILETLRGKREKLMLFGDDYDTPDGTGVRDYIHVVDLAKGHVAAVDYVCSHSGVEVFNLGTGTGYSVLDMVNAFREANDVALPYVIAPRRPGDIAVCYADPAKSADKLGWKAEKTLSDMCRDSWNWQRNNPSGYEG